jgi:histidine triad (HIT) family protein
MFCKQKGVLMSADCIFCKIIDRTIPSGIVAENEQVLVIQDRAPKAPVHYLIIPKQHVADISSLKNDELRLAEAIFAMAQQLSRSLPGKGDFRLLVNNGAGAGQSVEHLHAHFLAGKKMTDF